jgi:hypothetical protein
LHMYNAGECMDTPQMANGVHARRIRTGFDISDV